MIKFRFSWMSPEDAKDFLSVDFLFQELGLEAIQSSDMYRKCLAQIENARQVDPGVLRSNDSGVMFSIYDLGQGVKSLICAELYPERLFRLDSIGENLYPLLEYFSRDHDIRLFGILNPYELASIRDIQFYPMYLEQFDLVVQTSEEFELCKQVWISSNGKSVGLEYLIDWNQKLKQDICISWDGDPFIKSAPTFKLQLHHKFNFIQADSSQGKTLLLRSIIQLYNERLIVSEYEPVLFSGTVMNMDHKMLVLVDMDTSKVSLEFLHGLSNTSDNMVYLFVGHHLVNRVRVPWASVYTTFFRRKEHHIDIYPLAPLKPISFNHYDVVICEDAGSGMQLWKDSDLAKDATLVSANGYSKLVSNAKLYVEANQDSAILVVADYSTAEGILPALAQLQKQYPRLQVITPSSTEFMLMYLCSKYGEYINTLEQLVKFPKEKLKAALAQYGKSAVTLETIDFIAYCYVFGFVSEKEAKSYRALVKINPDLSKLRELIKFEFSSFGFPVVDDDCGAFADTTDFMNSLNL